jgi:hypothetical protein
MGPSFHTKSMLTYAFGPTYMHTYIHTYRLCLAQSSKMGPSFHTKSMLISPFGPTYIHTYIHTYIQIVLGTKLEDGSKLPYKINAHLSFWIAILVVEHVPCKYIYIHAHIYIYIYTLSLDVEHVPCKYIDIHAYIYIYIFMHYL